MSPPVRQLFLSHTLSHKDLLCIRVLGWQFLGGTGGTTLNREPIPLKADEDHVSCSIQQFQFQNHAWDETLLQVCVN
jgi:hypothetical protein